MCTRELPDGEKEAVHTRGNTSLSRISERKPVGNDAGARYSTEVCQYFMRPFFVRRR